MLTDDETRPFFRDNDTVSDGGVRPSKRKRWLSDIDYICLRRTLTLPFCIFAVFSAASILCGLFYIAEHDLAYMFSGPIGMAVSLYGFRHMKIIISLKGRVDDYSRNNIEMRYHVKSLKVEVNRVGHAVGELKAAHSRIQDANLLNRENLRKFRALQNEIDNFNVQNEVNLKKAFVKAVAIHGRWEEEMYKHQRDLLHVLYDRFECESHAGGLTKEKYHEFFKLLPSSYKSRFRNMGGFEALSGGKSIIQHSDFGMALDLFAEMEATDCDIDFEFKEEVVQSPGSDITTSPLTGTTVHSSTKSPYVTFPDESGKRELPKQRTIVINKRTYTTRLHMATLGNESVQGQLQQAMELHYGSSLSPKALGVIPDDFATAPSARHNLISQKSALGCAQSLSLQMSQIAAPGVIDKVLSTAGALKYSMADNTHIRDESILAAIDILTPRAGRAPQITYADDEISRMMEEIKEEVISDREESDIDE